MNWFIGVVKWPNKMSYVALQSHNLIPGWKKQPGLGSEHWGYSKCWTFRIIKHVTYPVQCSVIHRRPTIMLKSTKTFECQFWNITDLSPSVMNLTDQKCSRDVIKDLPPCFHQHTIHFRQILPQHTIFKKSSAMKLTHCFLEHSKFWLWEPVLSACWPVIMERHPSYASATFRHINGHTECCTRRFFFDFSEN